MPVLTLDTDHLRTLVAIAESGSFTRAANEVHKTQAAVSMQMRRLEDAVGKPLFARNGRLNRLTADGEHLLEYARRIIALNNEALSILTEPELSGYVRIGTPDDYAERFLPQIFARFARTHPLVEVEISCQGSTFLFDEIQDGKLDLAIVTHMDAKSRGEVIRREPLFWVGSPRHRIEDAEVLPLGMGVQSCSWRSAATKALDAIGRPYRVLYTSPSAAALSAAVMSGLAITVLPESAVRPGMKRFGEEDGFPPLPDCDIALLRAQRDASPSVDALAAHVVESLANLEPAALPWQ